jgi:hypothetical protein
MPERETWDDKHVDGSKRGRTAGEDPGAYIGHEPERATETIPGGLSSADERVSAVDSQPGDTAADAATGWGPPPANRRPGESANEDRLREAGDRS